MVSKVLLVLLAVFVVSSGFTQDSCCNQPPRRGECAGYSSRDATTLSMMGWGLGLGIGIATLCALIPNNTAENVHAH